jgi:hypothetical protein
VLAASLGHIYSLLYNNFFLGERVRHIREVSAQVSQTGKRFRYQWDKNIAVLLVA